MAWHGSADPNESETAVSHDAHFEWRFRDERFALEVSVPASRYRCYDDYQTTSDWGEPAF